MSTELVLQHEAAPPMSGVEIKERVTVIQDVMNTVMKPGVHFMVIPGTKKNSLLKEGSEILLTAFRIGVHPEVTDLSTDDEIRYVVKVTGIHIPTGQIVGVGIGEASTSEEKYRWQGVVCEEEFNATPETRRRIKWVKGKPPRKVQQVRTVPADKANTVLKMAKKRAQIDLTLTALGASDRFTQDMEDMAPADAPPVQGTPKPQAQSAATQQQASAPAGVISEKQGKMVYAKLMNAGITIDQFCQAFGVTGTDQLPRNKMDDAIAWIDGAAAPTTAPVDEDPPF